MAAKECTDRGGGNPDPELRELALDPHAAPSPVLSGEPQDQLAGGRIERRSPYAVLPSVGPLPPHELPVPPQQRRGTHHEGGPSWTGEHPARRGEHHPVEPAEARALLLTPHDLQLVTKDEYLDVLGQILRPGATRETEEPTYNDLEQGEQHGSSPFRSKEG